MNAGDVFSQKLARYSKLPAAEAKRRDALQAISRSFTYYYTCVQNYEYLYSCLQRRRQLGCLRVRTSTGAVTSGEISGTRCSLSEGHHQPSNSLHPTRRAQAADGQWSHGYGI